MPYKDPGKRRECKRRNYLKNAEKIKQRVKMNRFKSLSEFDEQREAALKKAIDGFKPKIIDLERIKLNQIRFLNKSGIFR